MLSLRACRAFAAGPVPGVRSLSSNANYVRARQPRSLRRRLADLGTWSATQACVSPRTLQAGLRLSCRHDSLEAEVWSRLISPHPELLTLPLVGPLVCPAGWVLGAGAMVGVVGHLTTAPEPDRAKLEVLSLAPTRLASRVWGGLSTLELPGWLRKPLLGTFVWWFDVDLSEVRNSQPCARRMVVTALVSHDRFVNAISRHARQPKHALNTTRLCRRCLRADLGQRCDQYRRTSLYFPRMVPSLPTGQPTRTLLSRSKGFITRRAPFAAKGAFPAYSQDTSFSMSFCISRRGAIITFTRLPTGWQLSSAIFRVPYSLCRPSRFGFSRVCLR